MQTHDNELQSLKEAGNRIELERKYFYIQMKQDYLNQEKVSVFTDKQKLKKKLVLASVGFKPLTSDFSRTLNNVICFKKFEYLNSKRNFFHQEGINTFMRSI